MNKIRSTTTRLVAGIGYKIVFNLGLMRLWKLLPASFRRGLVHSIVRLPERVGSVPPTMVAPVHLVGLSSSHSSLGWAVRAAKRTLEQEGYTPHIWNVATRFGADHTGGEPTDQPSLQVALDAPGTLVLCLNPNFLAHALAGLPEQLPRNKRIIGYFVWELETIPDDWIAPTRFVDEIWTPSEFVKQAFERAFPEKPVRLVPYAIEKPDQITPDPASFDLPSGYRVLVAANLQSGNSRKNVPAAIAAFRKAFGTRGEDGSADAPYEAPVLVLKLSDADRMPERMAWLHEDLKGVRHHLLTENLSDARMWQLIASCDLIFSMHRSEGYGLLMQQGLMLDKTVLATGWSGNVDFMSGQGKAHFVDYKLVPVEDPEGIYRENAENRWAEPDIDHAARILRQLHETWSSQR